MLDPADMPGFPDRQGEFQRLPPAHFRVVVRKAQGFTEQQIARESGISRRTVSSYAERARDRLGCLSFQEVQWAFYAEYAPGVWVRSPNESPIDPSESSGPTFAE